MDFDLRGELKIGNTWVDATGKILQRQSLTHTRGRQDQGARVDPSVCRPLLNNTDGRFSPDNPVGPYYGSFGRNTPFRFSLAAGTPALDLTGTINDAASTPDTAALDITGDIDVRIDATLSNWTMYNSGTLDTTQLFGKFGFAASTKSWFLGVRSKAAYFEWSADGTNTFGASSTVPLPVTPSGRIALRATLDVDNGASGRTITFYTAASGISGPWTQLGDPVVQSGTTSIFNSATALRIGRATDFAFTPPVGRVHKAEVRSGIGGTVVANPDFTVQTIGASSFVDAAGLTWTMVSPASISNRRIRLLHELAAYPTEWHPSGKHAWVDSTTAGILRRLRRGNHALDSTLRRRIPSGSPLAYWPLEDGRTATQFYSPIAGVRPMKMAGFDLAADDSLAGSSALPAVRSGATFSGTVPAPAGSPTSWHTEFVFLSQAGPATARTVIEWLGTGTVRRWQLLLDSGGAQTFGYDVDGNTVTSQLTSFANLGIFGAWSRWQLYASQNGGNVDYTLRWIPIGGAGGSVGGSYAGTVGRIHKVQGPTTGYSADLDGLLIGHIGVFATANTTIYNSADLGFAGETAGARMQRLASEESVPLTVCGVVSDQTLVGAQRPDGVLDLLQEAADADGGILYEDRELAALRYRSRTSMYNQTPALVLNYNAPGLAQPLRPTGDDDATENDVTVTRVGGSSARVVLEEGALSVQAPPDGVGIGYDTSYQLNLYSDDQVEQHAGWRLHLGTYEGRRYPQVHVMVHAAPTALMDQILAVDIGDKIVIQNPPIWVAPGDIELIVQGYEETFRSERQWDIVFNCTPGRPWTVAVADSTTLGKADTDGGQLATAVDATATTLYVTTTTGPSWTTDAAQYPVGLILGGEQVTATACTSAVKDTFTRTVANGWGTADVGGTWTVTGTAADYAVGSGIGSATQPSTGIAHLTLLPAPSTDLDLYGDVAASVLATGASLFAGLLARAVDNNNHYSARVEFTTANAIILSLRKRVTGTETQLGTFTTGLTHVAGIFYRVRMQLAGTTLRAKLWLATDAEPIDWQIEVTDSALTAAASVGTRSFSNTGNTNSSPVLRFDNFEIVNPQRFTVTRSVNGIVKAQSAGTAVSLSPSVPAAL